MIVVDEKYVEFLIEYSSAFDGSIPAEDLEGMIEVLEAKFGIDLGSLDPEDLVIENNDRDYRLEIDGFEGEISYNPDVEKDVNGYQIVGDAPPEIGGLS